MAKKSFKISTRISGVDDIVKRLNILGEKAILIIREAAEEGGNVILEEARKNINDVTGTLSKSLAVEVEVMTNLRAQAKIGPTEEGFYGRMVEFGHPVVKKKKVIGSAPPRPFLRPAIEESRQLVRARVSEIVKARLGL